ncbi:hypothetical protein COCSUDRAFT_33298 [Coccomyxa subellipsoidea C-169]|uniref:Uncharacterized protein n=1 Tax=Coccomyxa subellipsoidea (strain C-169) TaxID=574566 RepID=I0YY18_COCSC|nr:hypothetical protein COCSUDRAFT_33298 [Coccomyxa subellipsoidea C-169]EIE23287.1 hypothetical protein COCSUDRAFT_33298 [Coccomyxa subellipsoidea C-169]|eukprot:XP_005647831.1 hypothetical protein COCSUDRAFT_33298 [Coccomyxa subellipsoidea C-169]
MSSAHPLMIGVNDPCKPLPRHSARHCFTMETGVTLTSADADLIGFLQFHSARSGARGRSLFRRAESHRRCQIS